MNPALLIRNVQNVHHARIPAEQQEGAERRHHYAPHHRYIGEYMGGYPVAIRSLCLSLREERSNNAQNSR